jgi:hypothetical protein
MVHATARTRSVDLSFERRVGPLVQETPNRYILLAGMVA